MLVARHIFFDFVITEPANSRLEIILTNRRTIHVVASNTIRRTTRLAEIFLCIREPSSCIDSISELLISEFLASDIDCFEPIQFFTVISFAKIHHQFIVQYLLLFYIFEVMKILEIERKFSSDILTDTDSSLLSIEDLVGIIFIFDPIHDIEWEILSHRLDNRISLFVFVNKLSLVLWANIEFATKANHAIFLVINISFYDFTNSDFSEFYFHSKILRIKFFIFDNYTSINT